MQPQAELPAGSGGGDLLLKLRTELMQPEALKVFIEVYNEGVRNRRAERGASREALDRELRSVEVEIRNVVDAIAKGLFHASVQAKLDQLEARQGEIAAKLAAPEPTPISLHPNAAESYAAAIADLEKGLRDPKHGPLAREGVRSLIDSLVLHPRPDLGYAQFDLEIDGVLSEMRKHPRKLSITHNFCSDHGPQCDVGQAR